MTKENEKLRDCLRDAESIITNALRSQPEGDNECKIHLTKAVKDVLNLVYDAKSQMPDGSKYAMEGMGHPSAYDRPSNAAAMREALEIAKSAICHHAKYICQSLSWENSTINANCADILCSHRELCEAKTAIQKALAAPPRNCDRFDDLKSAQRHYIEHGCPKGLGMLVDGEIRKFPWKSQFEKWLFSTASWQEGEMK